MGLTRDKSQMKQENKPTNTLKTNCPHCGKGFVDRDNLIVFDGKVLHHNCVEPFTHSIDMQIYKTEFPYLNDMEIDRILCTEGESGFQTIRDNGWIILTSLGTQEMLVNGFSDQEGVKQHIVNHYEEEGGEQNAYIHAIFNNGVKYNYSVSITAALSEA